jgi:hypothetical protein
MSAHGERRSAGGSGIKADGEPGISASEEWSRAGWRAHLPGPRDLPAYVGRLGGATLPEG